MNFTEGLLWLLLKFTEESLLQKLYTEECSLLRFLFHVFFGLIATKRSPRLRQRFDKLTRAKSEEKPSKRLRVTHLGKNSTHLFTEE